MMALDADSLENLTSEERIINLKKNISFHKAETLLSKLKVTPLLITKP
jgi:hypothetical protein